MLLRTAILTALTFLVTLPATSQEVQTDSSTAVTMPFPGYTPPTGADRQDSRCGPGRCKEVCAIMPAEIHVEEVELSTRKVGTKLWQTCSLDKTRQLWSCGPDARFEWFPSHYETRRQGVLLSVCMQARNLDSAAREGRLEVTFSTERHW